MAFSRRLKWKVYTAQVKVIHTGESIGNRTQKIMIESLVRKENTMIQVVGLVTGEQILAKVDEKKTGLILKTPIILLPAGKGELGMAPWLPYSEQAEGILVRWNAIAWNVDAKPELANHYNTTFINGIVTPTPAEVAATAKSVELVES
jgi:hypothetical protein